MLQEISTDLSIGQLSEKLTSPLALEPGMLTGFSAYITKYLEGHFTPPDFEIIAKLTEKRSEQISNLLKISKNVSFENQTTEAVNSMLNDALDSNREIPDLQMQKIGLLFATFQHAFNAKTPEDIALLERFAATVNSDQFIRGNKKISPNFINNLAQLFHNIRSSIGIYLGGNTNSDNPALITAGLRYDDFNNLYIQPELSSAFLIKKPAPSGSNMTTEGQPPW